MPSHTPLVSSEIIPEFAIRKIIVSNEKATILCALMRPRDINYDNWLGSSEFNPYVKYYFIAVPKLSELELSRFYYPSLRVEGLYSISGGRNLALWETVLGPRNQTEVDNNRPNPFNLKGYTAVTLEEILQGQYFLKDPLIAAEDQVPINQGLLDDPEGYNTSFEVTIDLLNNPLGEQEEELNIMAFAQMDLLRLKEDFGLRAMRPLSQVGSELIYENCLVRSRQGFRTNGYMVVPETRRVFFMENGEAYTGPAHYHSEDSPAPSGYVGWMAGPAQGEMQEREKLSVREIENTKVVSRIFVQRALSLEGMNLSQDRVYNGYNGNESSDIFDPDLLSFGDQILQALNVQLGHLSSISRDRVSQYADTLRDLTITSLRRGNINLTDTSIDPEDLAWVSTDEERIYHGGIILLKMDDIITSNSALGYIYNLHNNSDSNTSRNILTEIMRLSKVENFSVSRVRLTAHPQGNNSVSSPDYEDYDKNQIEKHLIRTSAPRAGSTQSIITAATNTDSSIFELQPKVTNKTKTIIIKDYDLFRHTNKAKYEYNLEITLEDGILCYLEAKKEEYSLALKQYSEYVNEASRPYLDYRQSNYYNGSQFENGLQDQQNREQANAVGNYNYSIGDFSEFFKERSQQLKYRSDNIVDLYAELLYVLTAKEQFNSDELKQVKRSLLAKNTTIETLVYFLDIAQKLELKLNYLLEPYRVIQPSILDLGNKKKNISNTVRFPNKLIKVSGRANIIAKTFPNNSVFLRAALPRIPTQEEITVSGLPTLPLAPVAPSLFYGLTEAVVIPRGNTDEGAFSLDTERTFRRETIVSTNQLTTDEQFEQANSRVQAAIQKSNFAPVTKTENTMSVLDELDEVDNLLTQYGGASLESMITKATATSESEILNKGIEKDKFMTKDLQSSIVSSVVLSDNSESFEKEMEEKYKETFANREALKEVYNTIKTTLAVNSSIKRAKNAATFKEKVQQGKSGIALKAEKEKENQKNKKALTEKSFIPMAISPNGLVPATEVVEPTIVIYKNQSSALGNAVLTDNVILLQSQQTTVRDDNRQDYRTASSNVPISNRNQSTLSSGVASSNSSITNRNQSTPSGTSY